MQYALCGPWLVAHIWREWQQPTDNGSMQNQWINWDKLSPSKCP